MADIGIIVQPQAIGDVTKPGIKSTPSQQLSILFGEGSNLTHMEFYAQRLLQIGKANNWPVIFSISDEAAWDPVFEKALTIPGIDVVRGSDNDRLGNCIRILEKRGFKIVVRGSGDCAWHGQRVIEKMVRKLKAEKLDLVDNFRSTNGYPHGFNLDVVTSEALVRTASYSKILLPYDKAHVVVFAREFAERNHEGKPVDKSWAEKFDVKPFNVGYLNYDLPYDEKQIPQLYCASAEHLGIHRKVLINLLKKGINPLSAHIEQVMDATSDTPLTLPPLHGLSSLTSGREGGRTEALIEQNKNARLALLNI